MCEMVSVLCVGCQRPTHASMYCCCLTTAAKTSCMNDYSKRLQTAKALACSDCPCWQSDTLLGINFHFSTWHFLLPPAAILALWLTSVLIEINLYIVAVTWHTVHRLPAFLLMCQLDCVCVCVCVHQWMNSTQCWSSSGSCNALQHEAAQSLLSLRHR